MSVEFGEVCTRPSSYLQRPSCMSEASEQRASLSKRAAGGSDTSLFPENSARTSPRGHSSSALTPGTLEKAVASHTPETHAPQAGHGEEKEASNSSRWRGSSNVPWTLTHLL